MAPSDNKSLKQVAKETQSAAPSQLGDPVSLKAETSDSQPTEQDKPNKDGEHKSLKESMQESLKHNPSALGDPVSLKAETSETEPTADDRGTRGTLKTGQPKSKI
ncbi:hypothetical protein LTR56_016002 [Elasticomyces elasticus]|nr:hypothetical protein LTR22_025197 [Elasticomyces elasticus]KAK3633088.1 hypothetical protein LTR56_016002 [Elasticomyces elasticus]KAK4917920.1 hypothetical protein LTR49_014195 [Elasticomyces elasticus]KAK5753316.1 hypothetical protein LTS12_016559 [Elasticomyces elasticus]